MYLHERIFFRTTSCVGGVRTKYAFRNVMFGFSAAHGMLRKKHIKEKVNERTVD